LNTTARPVGVFDSGVGGLTVLNALAAALPQESFLYLGDTARLPYGTKSPATVVRYATRAAELLVDRGIKALVVACNTASAAALPALRERFAGLPVIGVVEPGAATACAVTRSGRIAVLATESTVAGGAYQRAIHALRPDAVIYARACQLFVALAEEGWITGDVALAAAHRYLDPLFAERQSAPDTLVLGCTHFPVLAPVLQQVAGPGVTVVDASAAVAAALGLALRERQLLVPAGAGVARLELMATDGVERFARVGATFLGRAIRPQDVALVDL
jgi:glutamate racemase